MWKSNIDFMENHFKWLIYIIYLKSHYLQCKVYIMVQKKEALLKILLIPYFYNHLEAFSNSTESFIIILYDIFTFLLFPSLPFIMKPVDNKPVNRLDAL